MNIYFDGSIKNFDNVIKLRAARTKIENKKLVYILIIILSLCNSVVMVNSYLDNNLPLEF